MHNNLIINTYIHKNAENYRWATIEEITKLIKKVAIESGANLIGIAPIERFKHAPKGLHPTDILPDAQSVISIAVRIPRSAIKANKIAHRTKNLKHQFIYMQFGYITLNNLLNKIAYTISIKLEKLGYETIPIPASFPSHGRLLEGAISHRHAAVAAGLGEFGWNNLLITPQYGTQQRLITIITSIELEPTPIYNGKKLCKYDEGCRVCIKVCPAGALSDNEGIEVIIGNRTFKYAKLDKWKCRICEGIAPPYFLNEEINIPEKANYEDYIRIQKQVQSWIRAYGRTAPMCGRCLTECPIKPV